MKISKMIIAVAILFATQLSAQQVQQEDKNLRGERKRVVQGIKSGEITKPEAAKIKKEMRDVKQATQAAKADGKVTKAEKKEIARQDQQLDRTIHRTKHNNRVRK